MASEDMVNELVLPFETPVSRSIAANRRAAQFVLRFMFTAVTVEFVNSLVWPSMATFDFADPGFLNCSYREIGRLQGIRHADRMIIDNWLIQSRLAIVDVLTAKHSRG